MSGKFEQPDGEGCARVFGLMFLAILAAGFGLGILFTVLLGVWL